MNFLYFDRLAMEMFPANCWEGEDKKKLCNRHYYSLLGYNIIPIQRGRLLSAALRKNSKNLQTRVSRWGHRPCLHKQLHCNFCLTQNKCRIHNLFPFQAFVMQYITENLGISDFQFASFSRIVLNVQKKHFLRENNYFFAGYKLTKNSVQSVRKGGYISNPPPTPPGYIPVNP